MVSPLLALVLSASAPVIEAKPAIFHSSKSRTAPRRPESLAQSAARLPESARHALPGLTPAEKAELASKDSRDGFRRKRPAEKVGIERPLPERVGFTGLPADTAAAEARVVSGGGLFERSASAAGGLTWTAGFSSEGAGALRLHITEASLPAGARVWVYGRNGEAHGPYEFERGLSAAGFWTNTVFAPEIFLEVQFPAGTAPSSAYRLAVASLVHLEHPGFAPGAGSGTLRTKSQECFVDAACVTPSEFPEIEQAMLGVAQLTFMDGGSAFVCTGGLLNSVPETFVPYLLTANHCFDNQASAESLEAVWQYVRSSCNGPEPSPALFPRTLGSDLRATGEQSDFTLVELRQDPPDNSLFFGWTAADVSTDGGTVLYRLSHPDGRPQFYTKEQISAVPDPTSCAGAAQGNYIYEKDIVGGTGGGSSGSLVYLGNLQVVGQEGGACGTDVDDDCDVVNNSTIDGAFAVSYPHLEPFIGSATPTDCVANATTLCLNGGRFAVTVSWARPNGTSGAGQAVPLTSDSGYFWFFNSANIELVVKVLQACSISNHFWVFAAGLTDVEVVMTVTDTNTGAQQVYTNPQGTAYVPVQDTSAFPCP
jgi:lysyl endopeptidase